MAVSVVASTTGTTTATLPAGTTSGDLVVVFAYSATATTPTLPASWTNMTSNAVLPAARVQYRVYDGVWTMPTFTSAARCHAVTLRGQHASPIGVTSCTNTTNQTITWPAVTLQDATGASALLRGAGHNRPDVVIPVSASHTGLQGEGTQPGFRTQYRPVTTSGAAATSATSRSDAWTQATVEVKTAAAAPQQYPGAGTAAVVSGVTGDIDALLAASGSVVAVSSASGDASILTPPQQYPASGTAAVVSGAVGGSPARARPASSSAVAVSGATGATAARLAASGTAAATSTATATSTALLPASGSVVTTSAASGAAGLQGGAQQLPASGTASATSGASGVLALRSGASGSVTALTSTSATVSLRLPAAGEIVALATAQGEAGLIAGVTLSDRLQARLRLPVMAGAVRVPEPVARFRYPDARATIREETP